MKRICLVLYITAALCSCKQPNLVEDYVIGLQRVLDTEYTLDTNKPTILTTPRTNLEEQAPIESNISIREFLSLRKCELHNVLAHKNSAIGKVATQSQQLFYELKILNTGPSCVAQLHQENKKKLATKLQEVLKQKQSILINKLWLALLGEPENRQFWQNKSLNAYPDKTPQGIAESINTLIKFTEQILTGNYHFSNQQFKKVELALGNLQHGDAGTLLTQFQHLSLQLSLANQSILSRLNSPLCLNSSPTPNARHLQTVVQNYFILNVQTQAVKLQRRYQAIIMPYLKLEERLSAGSPNSYSAWRQKRQTIFDDGLTSTQQHARLLKSLFKQCGLKPGNLPPL